MLNKVKYRIYVRVGVIKGKNSLKDGNNQPFRY